MKDAVHREIFVPRHDHGSRFRTVARMRSSDASASPTPKTCSARWPSDSILRANAGGSWASTRKRNHALRSTGWSFCLAANSSTATMSSASATWLGCGGRETIERPTGSVTRVRLETTFESLWRLRAADVLDNQRWDIAPVRFQLESQIMSHRRRDAIKHVLVRCDDRSCAACRDRAPPDGSGHRRRPGAASAVPATLRRCACRSRRPA
jgi:hypothetical protein